MNAEKAEEEIERIVEEYFDGNPPLCERCLESDFEEFACECREGDCVKTRITPAS